VHYHVIPRYLEAREFDGVVFADAAGPPDLGATADLGSDTLAKLQQLIIDNWQAHKSNPSL